MAKAISSILTFNNTQGRLDFFSPVPLSIVQKIQLMLLIFFSQTDPLWINMHNNVVTPFGNRNVI